LFNYHEHFYLVIYQPAPSIPSVALPPVGTTPIISFPPPQTPVQVAPGMSMEIIIIEFLFFFLRTK